MKRILSVMGALVLGSAALAHAEITINYQIGSGSVVQCADVTVITNASCTVGAGAGLLGLDLSATSTAPGDATQAQEFDSTNFIEASAATTITIWVSATSFTAPTTPPTLIYLNNETFDGTFGASGTTSATGCVVSGSVAINALATNFCPSTPVATLSNPTTNVTAGIGGSSLTTSVPSLAAPYILEEKITLSLGAGSAVQFGSSQALTPVPEPTSIAMLGGVLVLAGGAIRRKLQKS